MAGFDMINLVHFMAFRLWCDNHSIVWSTLPWPESDAGVLLRLKFRKEETSYIICLRRDRIESLSAEHLLALLATVVSQLFKIKE